MTHKLIEVLKHRIKELVDFHDESLRWAAKQMHVDYSLVYRIVEEDQKSIAFSPAFKIAKYFFPDTHAAVLKENFPNEVRDFLEKEHPYDEQQQRADERMLATIYNDAQLYEVYLFALYSCRDLQGIEKEFGNRGLMALEILQEINALRIVDNGKIDGRLTESGYILMDDEQILRLFQLHGMLVNLETRGSNVWSYAEGMNEAGVAAAYNESESHRMRMSEIFKDSKYRGNIVTITSGLVGPLAGKRGIKR